MREPNGAQARRSRTTGCGKTATVAVFTHEARGVIAFAAPSRKLDGEQAHRDRSGGAGGQDDDWMGEATHWPSWPSGARLACLIRRIASGGPSRSGRPAGNRAASGERAPVRHSTAAAERWRRCASLRQFSAIQ